MSTHPATRSRWMDWKPKVGILADPAESEPTKPSKPGFAGFEGATSAEPPETEAVSDPAELARASAVLNRAGVRIMAFEGGATIGVWSDLDGPEVRAALRTFGSDRLPFGYLDGAGVPMRYKLRRVEGEPVPMNVLAEMERHPAEPWKVRDRMLNEMGWCSKGIPWVEWKAAALNRLFQEQGVTGKPGRITAATVRHGERRRTAMAEKLIHLPVEEARAAKWRRGREQYGPVFIGHPLEELDEELLDAMNYAEEAARRGFPMTGVAEDLQDLCERTRAIYRAVVGIVATCGHEERE